MAEILQYRICPNRSAVCEYKGLGARPINFNNTDCRLLPSPVVYIIFMVTGSTWTFVYKEVAICAYAPAKRTRISLEFYCLLTIFFMFYQAFGVNLSLHRCGMFVVGGACASIRYCASICTYSVFLHRNT